MLQSFQNIIVSPVDKMELLFNGEQNNGVWNNGELISADKEYQVRDGIPFFGSEKEGDQFLQEDISFWTNGGGFKRRWERKGLENEYVNKV